MKRWAVLLLLAAIPLCAQVSVESGKQARLQVPGATAAVSLDPHIADTLIDHNVLIVTGFDVGDTRVVAVREGGIWEFAIHVTPGAPHYPPGFAAPENPSQESGSVEAHFSSDQQQFENIVDVEDHQLLQTTQLHMATASFAAPGERSVFVPSAYYRVITRHRDLTLLDRTVNESQLSLQNVVLRGLHVTQGDWHFHAGYTASANFADVLIPTQKEIAAGLSANVWVSKHFTVTPGFYFLRSIDFTDGQPHSGGLVTLVGDARLVHDWKLRGEIGYGRSMAYAGELHHNTESTQLNATIMQRKLSFPALRTSNLPGLTGSAYWTQLLSPRWSLFSGGSINDIVLKTMKQDSRIAFGNVRYKLSRSWSAGTGFDFGTFTSTHGAAVRMLTLPQEVSFERARFGAALQYNFSTISNSFSSGGGVTQTLHLNWQRWQLGEFFDWQRDALGVSALASQSPALQQALQKIGMLSARPEQLLSLLQDANFLHTLGAASQAQILAVPQRVQYGGSLNWVSPGAHPHQLNISALSSANQFASAHTQIYSVSAAWAKQISGSNYVQASYSLVQAGPIGYQAQSHLVFASFRHTFTRNAEMFWAAKKTNITGTVFVDQSRTGIYTISSNSVPGAVVVLDGQRRVATDAAGHFRFSGVSEGDHQVQLQYHSEREHFFTTPPDAVVAGGASVDFGIAFSAADLWGYVQDDTGNGLANVALQLKTASGDLHLLTDKSGKFDTPDAPPGVYQVEVDPASVALGYATEGLAPVEVRMAGSASTHPVLRIPAMRNFTGQVTIYDAAAGRYVAVKGAMVRIAKLERIATTNANGRFLLGGLPAGDLEVNLEAAQSSASLKIHLPAQPVTLRRDFRISSLSGEIASIERGQTQ